VEEDEWKKLDTITSEQISISDFVEEEYDDPNNLSE